MTSRVYFADMRSRSADQTISNKLRSLFDVSEMHKIISEGDVVALKVHLGTGENHRHLRPEHVRAVVEKVQEAGGKPFVTETTGIGLASIRGTAVGCIKTATLHGFTQETLGAPIVIADGLKGLSGVKVKINGIRMREVEIAQAIAESDAMISIAHVKGHPRTGLAATLKNIGIGCLTKVGKAPLYMAKKPKIDQRLCNNCGVCIRFCPVGAIRQSRGRTELIQRRCIVGCGCWDVCPQKAITRWNDLHHPRNSELIIRNVDAAAAVVKHIGRDKIAYLNLAYEITPHCDCADYGDVPMVPDIGVFASRDPVAVDKAASDAVIKAPGIAGSAADEVGVMRPGDDKFTGLSEYSPFAPFRNVDQTREWRIQFEVAEKLRLGTTEYELVKIE
ncbi:DUF362 domain-containing protein [Candidatus Bathyarchaeota archaeon]|nr:DUF362 domain-containing protein [Candidatus Bathyarchaeota archaeon]